MADITRYLKHKHSLEAPQQELTTKRARTKAAKGLNPGAHQLVLIKEFGDRLAAVAALRSKEEANPSGISRDSIVQLLNGIRTSCETLYSTPSPSDLKIIQGS